MTHFNFIRNREDRIPYDSDMYFLKMHVKITCYIKMHVRRILFDPIYNLKLPFYLYIISINSLYLSRFKALYQIHPLLYALLTTVKS